MMNCLSIPKVFIGHFLDPKLKFKERIFSSTMTYIFKIKPRFAISNFALFTEESSDKCNEKLNLPFNAKTM